MDATLSLMVHLEPLKRSTRDLIEVSRNPNRQWEEGDSDFLDWSIIDTVDKIERNPYLALTGSCSGHDGFPFLAVVFMDGKVRDFYLGQIRKLGYLTFLSADTSEIRMGWFVHNFPEITVKQEWNIGLSKHKASPKQAREFWARITEILATHPT